MTLVAISLIGAVCSAGLALWRKPVVPRYLPLLALALVPQLISLAGWHLRGGFFLSIVVVFAWCLCNRAIPGALVTGAGVGMNLVVMAWHGGLMPIRTDVLAAIGQAAAPGTVLLGSKDIAVLSSPLWWLSDWIIIRLPTGPIVASPGDFVVAAGVVWWLLFSHRAEKEPNHADSRRNPDVGRAPNPAATRPE